MSRGALVPLTALQRRDRMLYLVGELAIDKLTNVMKNPAALVSFGGYATDRGELITPVKCPSIYYRLNGDHDGLPNYNGGTDPTDPDPADRWKKPGSTFVNRTSDCIGGMAWAGGFDRYQPDRFPHYGGYINTNSMRIDCRVRKPSCFKRIERPELGCFVVFESDPNGKVHGVKTGHIGGIVSIPAEFAPQHKEWWMELGVVDIAGRIGRANMRGNGLTWWKKDSYFVIPTMTL